MTSFFAWFFVALSLIGVVGSAYFFDKSAEEGIAKAEEHAAHANSLAGEAHERAAELERQAAEARVHAAELEQQIVMEQRQRAIDQRRLYPRYVDVEEMGSLERALKGRIDTLNIFYVANDPEVWMFASNIADVIRSFGIVVELKAAPPEFSVNGALACFSDQRLYSQISEGLTDGTSAGGGNSVVGITPRDSVPWCPDLSIVIGKRPISGIQRNPASSFLEHR